MPVQRISLSNVRSHDLFSAEFHPEITLILGRNGIGKTTLLEGLYFLHRGTSFRGRDRDMIPYEKPMAELKLEFDHGDVRRATLSHETDGKVAKSFLVEGKKTARLSALQRMPVVLFEPDELRILTSSPARRREFIDGVVGRISPTYQTVLSRYARTLLQRNELLKQIGVAENGDQASSDSLLNQLFAWDVKLAELGSTIVKTRVNFISHANEHLSRLYSSMAGSEHRVLASYVGLTAADDALQQILLQRLESSRRSDTFRGHTSVGPHRDDIDLSLDGHPASDVASRGELRTIMLAFKLLEVELQQHHSGEKPLILLDDVFSELDSERERRLMESLRGYQTIITATDLRDNLKSDRSVIYL